MDTLIVARRVALGMFLVLALPIPATGERAPSGDPQEETQLAEELQALVRQLREERAAFYGRHRSRSDQLEAVRSPVRRLELELSELRGRETEADRSLAETRADLEKLKKEEAADGLRAQIVPEVETSIRQGREFIKRGIPYRTDDRSQRLGEAGIGSLQEQASRYWSFLQEEVRIARSGEALSAEIPLSDGRAKPARIFRVGQLIMGYVTEDGLEAGLWNGKEWVPAAHAEEEKTIRQAVEILDRRRTPELLTLPVLRREAP